MSLTDEHFRALGRITVDFSTLEFVLAGLLAELIAPDRAIGQILASQLSFSKLVTAVGALFLHRASDGPDTQRLADILKRAAEAEFKRNTAIHSAYLITAGAPTDIVTRVKVKTKREKGLSHDAQDMTPTDLNQIADEINSVVKDLARFIGDISTAQPRS